MTDVRTHTALARELSIGVLEALSVFARGRESASAVLSEHDATVQSSLPGF